jgi:hypothetical protein
MDFDDSSRTLSTGSVLSEETLIPEEDELSDEQIEFLLRRASLRVKSKSGSLPEALSETFTTKLPSLKGISELPSPYTVVQKGVARIEENKILNEQQRQTADKPKKIEDPVTLKKNKKEREYLAFLLSPLMLT